MALRGKYADLGVVHWLYDRAGAKWVDGTLNRRSGVRAESGAPSREVNSEAGEGSISCDCNSRRKWRLEDRGGVQTHTGQVPLVFTLVGTNLAIPQSITLRIPPLPHQMDFSTNLQQPSNSRTKRKKGRSEDKGYAGHSSNLQ